MGNIFRGQIWTNLFSDQLLVSSYDVVVLLQRLLHLFLLFVLLAGLVNRFGDHPCDEQRYVNWDSNHHLHMRTAASLTFQVFDQLGELVVEQHLLRRREDGLRL